MKANFIVRVLAGILSLTAFFNAKAQTSWKGTVSTNWSTATNWTAGVPSATVDAIIGDASFTGSYQPTLTATSTCKNLTVGGAVASTLTIARSITVSGNVLINANGTILANTSSRTITLKGNWTNSGTYTATASSSKLTLSGTAQTLTGATTFKNLTINSGSTLTLANNISVGVALSISGTLNPATNIVSGAGTMAVNSTGTIYVYAATFAGNYTISGTITLNRTSTVNYASAATAQTISSSFTYGILRISGGSTKSLAANLPGLSASSTSSGKIYIDAGTFDLNTFTANRASSGGGAFTIAAGAQLRIGGTNGFPSNYTTLSLATTSTVDFYGNNQTILATAYGNLLFSSTSGAVTKTMPATALTIAGNFTSSVGTGTSVSYTAAQNITVNKDITIGASCTFNGSTFSHTFKTNWINNGTFTGNASTVTFSGISANLSGTGTNSFFNLTFTASGITANNTTVITVTGNLSTTAPGVFTHNAGGSLTMSGASKTLSGNGFELSNLIITGSITSTANITITGNLTNNGTFAASSGNITMNGSSKVINGSSNCTFYTLNIDGSITTANTFTMLANLAVAISGTFTASAGSATFNGTSSLSGTANLYNVVINATKTLTLGSTSVLGISNAFTKTGTLDVTSIVPNTVNYNGSGAQSIIGTTYHNLELSNSGIKTPSAAVTVNNDFTINSGVTFDASSYVFSLYRHWNKFGSFNAATSDVQLRGSNAATITGATTFNNFTVNKSSSLVRVTLENNVIASNIAMTAGNINTGTNSITTTNGRTGNGIILGTITHNHSFSTATAYSFEGPNNLITFTNPSGISWVTVKSKLGEITDFDPAIECVTREYKISMSAGTYTNAKLRFHYENNELNAFSEPYLSLYKYNSGIVWDSIGFTSRDTAANYVEQTGIATLPGRFTCSGTRNIVRWNGSVSSAWNNTANWTTVSGTSMANRVPNSTDAAYLGSGGFTNNPTISTTQQVSVLRFGSAQATTLTISGGSLTTSGSLRGQWSTSRSHILDVSSGTLIVGTHLLLSDSVNGHDITLKIGTGTVNTTYDFEQTATGAVNFTGSGSLVVSGNYNYSSGTFTAGSGSVVYSGGEAQTVAPIIYNNLTFSKTTERATFNSPTRINGNLTINTGGEIELLDTLTVAGNVSIGASSYLINEGTTIKLAGNWLNNGYYICNNGTVNFNGTGAQSSNASTFSNVTVNKSAGTLTTTNNIIINGNLSINSGTMDLDTFLANRASEGGILTIGSGATIKIAGTNNFPDNFITNTLNSLSTVVYDGTVAQTIRKVTYGNITFSNGGSNAKSLIGNVQMNGDLLINSGSTFNPDINSISLYGNFTNSGTFTPATSTLNLNGTTKTFTGTTTLNNLSVITGSYTVASGTVSMAGDLYIESTGSLSFGNNTAILDGDLTNKGALTSNGTATFTGTREQTIRLLNSITSASTGIVNFNGTVSPVINSTSSPAFATVNINNTGGITTSVPWFVYFACNIAAGATLNCGPLTHTFYGNFTNNGTVTSSGKLKFSPGAPFSASGTIRLDGVSFISTGEVEFAGTAPITILNVAPTLNVVSVTNTNASGITPPTSWAIADELNIGAGATFYGGSATSHLISGSLLNNGTLDGQTSTIRFDGNPAEINGIGTTTFNHIKIESAGDLTLNSVIGVKQNFIVDGNFNGNAGTVIFTGTSASTISGTATSVTFGDLEQSKTGTTTTLSLPVSITDDLTLTNGKIMTTATNILTMEDNSSSTSGTATSFVSGPMKKVGDDAFVFPVGKGTKWRRLGIGAPASTTDAFTIQYFNTPYADTLTMASSPSPVLNSVSAREYWTCDRVNGTSNVKVQLFWENTLDGVHYFTSDLVVAHWNGSAWENMGQSAITASSPGDVTSNTVSSFSPFTFGSLTGINPLPVSLINFEGHLNSFKEVDLTWETANEVNNDFFTIERSTDGSNFEFLVNVKSAGSNSNLTHYSAKDNKPHLGISYYRLKQTDLNGKMSYSNIIIIVNNQLKAEEMVIYPSPTNGLINIDFGIKTEGKITIENSLGKIVYTEDIDSLKTSIDLSGIDEGIYFITLVTKTSTNRIKFIKI